MIYRLAKSLFLPWGDRDDLYQEGQIGLWKGLCDWDPVRGSLYKFLKLAIRRQLINAFKMANRRKHQPLTKSDSLFRPTCDDDGPFLLERIAGVESAEDAALRDYLPSETTLELQAKLAELRETLQPDSLNARVLDDLVQYPPSTEDILGSQRLERLGIHYKSLDNTIQRIRRRAQDLDLRTGTPLKTAKSSMLTFVN